MNKHASHSRYRTRYLAILWPVLALLGCAALWTATAMRADAEMARAHTQALKEADAYAQAYQQYVTRSIAQMDQITMQLKHSWEHSAKPNILENMRRDGMFTDDAFVVVTVVGADGSVRSSTRAIRRDASFSQTHFFQQHRNNNSTALRVGVAPAELHLGREAVLFTRRLDTAEDEFDGVVLMAVDANYFTSFIGPTTLGPDGLLAIAATEGKLRVEQRGAGKAIASGRSMLPAALATPAGGAGPRLVDGAQGFADAVPRVLGWRRSAAYPLVAMVALSYPDAVAAATLYRKESRANAIVASLCLALLAGLGSLLSLRAEARQREQEEVRRAYRTATESANDGFYMAAPVRDRKGQVVDFRIVDCNERGAYFYGMRRNDLVGSLVSTIDRSMPPSEVLATYRVAMANGFHEEERRMPQDERMNIAWGRRRLVRVGNGLAVTLQDISERKKHEDQLERLANEDSLTGLPNRHWLLNSIPAVLARCGAAGDELALLFIDLDEFKQVNDSHGHAVGDRLLKAAAQRLVALLRPLDRVARFGGDEFVVLLHPGKDQGQVAGVAERIVAAFRAPFVIGDGLQAAVGASVGVSIFPRDGADASTLIRHADIAMYAGKNEGKGQHRFFDHALSGTVRKRVQLKQRLMEAVEQDQFLLHYQPRVDPRSGALVSMEALLRWSHPEGGMIAPGEFIPLAESSGLILPIGEMVIDKACAQLAAWRAQGAQLVPVSINVSPKQFVRGGVMRQLDEALCPRPCSRSRSRNRQ
jgi:diguanylate cyclase (GGDEF)-like protein